MTVMTDLFQNRGDLVEKSEILESEPIREIDLGRLLKAGHYQAYTDFIMTTSCEQLGQARDKIEAIQTQTTETKKFVTASNDKIA